MSTSSAQLEILQPEEPSAIEAIERAQIDTQIATAKRYPRVLSKVKADMLSFATLDEETALSTFYTLPRGGKTIQGPSVRMAEIAISCYGNLRAGARPIQTVTTGEFPHVIVQAVCHDLEKNVAISIEKRRRIVGKKSKGGAIDEDDVNLATNACAAIAFRDAVFKVVPGALIKPVYEQAKAVAVGDIKSLGAKRTKVIERLTQMGAKLENILGRVEAKKVEDIDLTKLEVLIGLGTSLKDGETTLEEAFPTPVAEAPKSIFGAHADKEKKAEKKAEAAPTPEPAQATEQAAAQPNAEQPTPEPAGSNPITQAVAEVTGTPGLSDPTPSSSNVDKLQDLMLDNDVNEHALLKWAAEAKHIPASITSVTKIPEAKAAIFVNNWTKVLGGIRGEASK